MSFIESAITREETNLLYLRSLYENELLQLPKGSLHVKKRNNKSYYYLSYRDGKRVVSDYIGSKEENVLQIKEQLEKRKHIEKMIKRLNSEIKLIKKTLEGIK